MWCDLCQDLIFFLPSRSRQGILVRAWPVHVTANRMELSVSDTQWRPCVTQQSDISVEISLDAVVAL
jgi:hypothetical protein